MLNSYINEESANPVCSLHLKDEPRDANKVDDGKTRPFFMAPTDYLVVSRMVLAPFYTLMVEYNDIFCCSVGIDAHSQSGKLYHELNNFSECILEGDYSNFDQSMPADVSITASSVVYRVLKLLGYNEDALKILAGVLNDGIHCHIEVLKDLFVALGIQPSGKYGTAEDNCIKNIILLMYGYAKSGLNLDTFFDNVLPKTYGDDLLASIKPNIVSQFNNNVYAKLCESYLGMKFTSPSKSNVFPDYVNIMECSFLKRRFRIDTHQRILFPLESSSIFKMLGWYIPSKVVPYQVQFEGMFQAALWETALFLNEDKHNEFRSFLIYLSDKHKIMSDSSKLPSYNYILNQIYG